MNLLECEQLNHQITQMICYRIDNWKVLRRCVVLRVNTTTKLNITQEYLSQIEAKLTQMNIQMCFSRKPFSTLTA